MKALLSISLFIVDEVMGAVPLVVDLSALISFLFSFFFPLFFLFLAAGVAKLNFSSKYWLELTC